MCNNVLYICLCTYLLNIDTEKLKRKIDQKRNLKLDHMESELKSIKEILNNDYSNAKGAMTNVENSENSE